MTGNSKPARKPTPKGINPKTGEPYEPIKRKDFAQLIRRAATPKKP